MQNFSTTQAANYAAFASLIVLIARHFKYDVNQEDVVFVIASVIGVIAVIKNYVNRYKKGDLTLGGFKK